MMEHVEDPIPPWLQGVVAAMQQRRAAAEWEMALRAPVPSLDAQLDALLSAFPWMTVHEVETRTEHGIEATFDLALTWVDADQRLGRSILPCAARWYVDLVAATQVLTLWPNLFTDEINLYQPVGDNQFSLSPFAFAPAAARNRAQLAASLHAWSLRSGDLVSCDSDTISDVSAAGIAATAHPVPRLAR